MTIQNSNVPLREGIMVIIIVQQVRNLFKKEFSLLLISDLWLVIRLRSWCAITGVVTARSGIRLRVAGVVVAGSAARAARSKTSNELLHLIVIQLCDGFFLQRKTIEIFVFHD